MTSQTKECLVYTLGESVTRYYCLEDQICCANKCCTPTNSNYYKDHWYIWFAVVITIFILLCVWCHAEKGGFLTERRNVLPTSHCSRNLLVVNHQNDNELPEFTSNYEIPIYDISEPIIIESESCNTYDPGDFSSCTCDNDE
ncbi:unnamed protein product [Ceutorhynchus assimilis]|uniref:Vesicular, overexpressed in cancer, prosurvival protein 1 n=1 Tax=Ceutorhynchus assimilis TaxID=467358 RepID=A0A9N9QAV2_9CUCU|nr:unnamed protein product [Ceutorhynchus assimilis]